MCEKTGLLAGFAKVDMTPDYQVSLGGYGDEKVRLHEMVEEPIYTTCIALTEGDETILLYTFDILSCKYTVARDIRQEVTKATGIPGEKIFCAATHAHSAPAYGIEKQFMEDWKVACVKAAKLALADRAPAKILAAKKKFPGMTFVRHVRCADGSFAGANFGRRSAQNPAVGYACEADDQMVLIKFEREGLKKPILMVNWQGHPDCGKQIGRRNMAPSYPAPLRDALSALTGCLVAYFTGADGNMNPDSTIQADAHNLNWREYGVKMAQLAYELMQELQEVEGSGIVTKQEMVEVDIDHSWDPMLEQAKEVYNLWRTVGFQEGNALGRTYGFSTSYQANAIIRRAAMDPTDTLEINAFRVGGIGFTTGTYEMFSESGIFVKENSPFAFTFLLTGNFTYIPSDGAFNYRCYEADTGYYARGTAEKLAERYVEMLKEIQ